MNPGLLFCEKQIPRFVSIRNNTGRETDTLRFSTEGNYHYYYIQMWKKKPKSIETQAHNFHKC